MGLPRVVADPPQRQALPEFNIRPEPEMILHRVLGVILWLDKEPETVPEFMAWPVAE